MLNNLISFGKDKQAAINFSKNYKREKSLKIITKVCYRNKFMAKKKIEEVSVEVKQEQDMLNLTGVIKAEMDDAKDFIHQVEESRIN